jgi:hypothetical protein
MPKTTGLGDNLYLGAFDLSGDIGSIKEIGGAQKPLPVPGINALAYERRGGQRGGGLKFTAWFNASAGQEHPVLSALPTTDVVAGYFRGTAVGSPTACLVAKQVNYDPTRKPDGELSENVELTANAFGLEWGDQLTAGKRTDTTATNGADLDGGASSGFGLQAYLWVFGFTGTSVVVKLQDSPDGVAWTDVTGGSFGAIAAVGAQRIATAGNLSVAQHLRVITGTGTFTSITFACSVTRNLTAVVF